MRLDADCTTDTTIVIPDGFTLDGRNKTITAIDPVGGHFLGAVIRNGGAVAHVRNLTVAGGTLTNLCDGGGDRLRGIMFEGASGSITHSTVRNINQGASGCQEGNAIEVRNEPFDGTHPATKTVEVTHNRIIDWQKTGIVANGDVYVDIRHNEIGASATQANLAANSVQFGFGGGGRLRHNDIAGNSWKVNSSAAATGVLLFEAADGLAVEHNSVIGNADVGIYVDANNADVRYNRVWESGPDGFYDTGIGNYGDGNRVKRNIIRGYDEPIDPPTDEDGNIILRTVAPQPPQPEPFID